MIIKKKDINRVLLDAKEALLQSADTAFFAGKCLHPAEIQYWNTDIALPKQWEKTDSGEKLQVLNTQQLYETLQMFQRGQLPAYLLKLGTIPEEDEQINIGAIVKKSAAAMRRRVHTKASLSSKKQRKKGPS